ncbi:HAD-like domain-containing protein [Pseudohyphozyma bogoriensis]|nr:HAD-like domain-containing protein [Pseudohyphozyma bogoriensis]
MRSDGSDPPPAKRQKHPQTSLNTSALPPLDTTVLAPIAFPTNLGQSYASLGADLVRSCAKRAVLSRPTALLTDQTLELTSHDTLAKLARHYLPTEAGADLSTNTALKHSSRAFRTFVGFHAAKPSTSTGIQPITSWLDAIFSPDVFAVLKPPTPPPVVAQPPTEAKTEKEVQKESKKAKGKRKALDMVDLTGDDEEDDGMDEPSPKASTSVSTSGGDARPSPAKKMKEAPAPKIQPVAPQPQPVAPPPPAEMKANDSPPHPLPALAPSTKPAPATKVKEAPSSRPRPVSPPLAGTVAAPPKKSTEAFDPLPRPVLPTPSVTLKELAKTVEKPLTPTRPLTTSPAPKNPLIVLDLSGVLLHLSSSNTVTYRAYLSTFFSYLWKRWNVAVFSGLPKSQTEQLLSEMGVTFMRKWGGAQPEVGELKIGVLSSQDVIVPPTGLKKKKKQKAVLQPYNHLGIHHFYPGLPEIFPEADSADLTDALLISTISLLEAARKLPNIAYGIKHSDDSLEARREDVSKMVEKGQRICESLRVRFQSGWDKDWKNWP